MGLVERRAVKAFQEQQYPRLKAQIDEAAGFEVPLEVDWPSLTLDDYAHLYDEAFEKVYFLPLIEALKAITVDDMGREALKDGLEKVTICYGGSSTDISFENGILKIDHYPVSNLDYWEERRDQMQRALEKGL